MSNTIYHVSKEQIKTVGVIMNHSTMIRDPEQKGENIIIETWNNDYISDSPNWHEGRSIVRVDIKYEVRRDGKKRVLSRKENGKKVSVKTSKKRKWH